MLFVQFLSLYRRPEFARRRSVRKMWWASAVVAGGIILLGTAPAQADPLLPGTADAQQQTHNALNYVLHKTNGMVVSTEGPLGAGSPVGVQPGDNSTGVPSALSRENTGAPRPDLPAADVVGGALPPPAGAGGGGGAPRPGGRGGPSPAAPPADPAAADRHHEPADRDRRRRHRRAGH